MAKGKSITHQTPIKHHQTPIKHHQTPSNENQTPSNVPSNAHQTKDDRQTAYKSKVANMVQALKDKGIKANMRMKIDELQTLFDTHCKQTSNAHQTPSNENQTPIILYIADNRACG